MTAAVVHKDTPVLVVDDSPAEIKRVKALLNGLGLTNVDGAAGGEIALEKIRGKAYGLVVCDWIMEGMSGLDVVKTLRSEGNDVPFIMVTGNRSVEYEIEALGAGADQFIRKPVYLVDLIGLLSSRRVR